MKYALWKTVTKNRPLFAVKNLKTVKVQTPTIFISSEETKQFKLTNKILFRIQIELSICLLIKTMSMIMMIMVMKLFCKITDW